MELCKIPFNKDKIKITRIYENKERLSEYRVKGLDCEKIKYVYGELVFPEIPSDRPYTFGSFVLSLDGKIAFEDAPEGPFIAKKNIYDQDGADTDFFILNMLRANADGIIVGAKTMANEPGMTAHIFDQELEDARVKAGYGKIPYNIVISQKGKEIPFDHILLNTPEIPVMILTSPEGVKFVEKNLKRPYFVIDSTQSNINEHDIIKDFNSNKDKIIVLVTGEGSQTNIEVSLKLLKLIGINKLLIESPTFTHALIKHKMLDEMFLNYSCIYLGGKAVNLGFNDQSFTSTDHPHTEVITIHAHSPHFFYFRHRLIYDNNNSK
ncbi:MAG: dihydrofolate reductase family protein [Caloramator sp.]|nr:dihydrofolate reductase family protein [Caloramator sp.]